MRKSFLMVVYFGKYYDGSVSNSETFELHGKSVKSLKDRAKFIIERLKIDQYRISLSGFRGNKLTHYFSNF